MRRLVTSIILAIVGAVVGPLLAGIFYITANFSKNGFALPIAGPILTDDVMAGAMHGLLFGPLEAFLAYWLFFRNRGVGLGISLSAIFITLITGALGSIQNPELGSVAATVGFMGFCWYIAPRLTPNMR